LYHPGPYALLSRATDSLQPIHVVDLRQDQAYKDGEPLAVAAAEVGIRTVVVVPMCRDDTLIGFIVIYRKEVRPFTDKQVALLANFARQAVIAIENTRLLNEIRESLQQQTATADVLKVISRSAFDLKSVLQTLVESAARLCDADKGTITRQIDGVFYRAEYYGYPTEIMKRWTNVPVTPERGSAAGRALLEGHTVHIPDADADPDYNFDIAGARIRSMLGVPMLREGVPIGVLVLARSDVRPFTDKQIDLVSTFADQAAIAIENVRLFDDVQKRTAELTEALEQQTATADVLKVISRSTFDLQVVLDTLLSSAIRLCDTERGMIFRYDGDSCRAVAAYNLPPEFLALWERTPVRASRATTVGRALLECRPVQIVDVQADPDYAFDEAQKMFAFRTVLAVPMLREGIPKGVIALVKTEVEAFTDKQIALVETFADQAAIAIENVRLFDEIQEKSRQLGEASQHKSQFLANMSHELRTPLNAIIGVTEMLLEDARDFKRDDEVEPLDRVLGAGRHLLALINDILDLSKIEAGRMELHLETFPLVPLINDVAKTIEPMATKNGNQVVIVSLPDLGTIHADQIRCRQALLNLASNANKFTEKGTVTIAAQPQRLDGRDWITIAVTDTGIGMTPEQMGKLFQEFSRGQCHGRRYGKGAHCWLR
jgi:GAF domain-containing protein